MSTKPQPKPQPEPKAKPEPKAATAASAPAAGTPAPIDQEPAPASEAPTQEAAPEESDQDDLKRKYREAMARKHGNSGATHKGHDDSGSTGPTSSGGPTQRMFRRKAGG